MSNAKLRCLQEIVKAVKIVVDRYYARSKVGLHEPVFNGREKQYLDECIDSTFVSSVGSFVTRFEQKLIQYTGAKHAIAVMNGTSGIHLALHAYGVVHGDEVLMPSLTFVATANAVSYTGAVPHFIDVEAHSFGVCPQKLRRYLNTIAIVKDGVTWNRETGARIKVLLPVHIFGHPCQMNELYSIVQEYPMGLIEDAAEGLGSFLKNKHVGTFGHAGVLSFNGNKIITTGGGGVVLSNDAQYAEHMRFLSTTAKQEHQWQYYHTEMAFNYRMPNLNAALGCAQLEQLGSFLVRKKKLFEEYQKVLQGIQGCQLMAAPQQASSNYWLHAIVLHQDFARHRDTLLEMFHDVGIGVRPLWEPMHRLPMYSHHPKMDLMMTECLVQRVISIPSGVA